MSCFTLSCIVSYYQFLGLIHWFSLHQYQGLSLRLHLWLVLRAPNILRGYYLSYYDVHTVCGDLLTFFYDWLFPSYIPNPSFEIDIGDRINISDPTKDTEKTGSSTWFVRDVNLFSSTMCFAATNEVATYSNGSLASCRIINAARSPNAVVQFNLKFPIDVSYEKLQVFHKALEEFVKARPREYQSFSGFRCTQIEAEFGYVQYIVLANHRESWQNLRSILTSKAELASFALELSKKMNLRYRSPPMPIDLRMTPATMNSIRGTSDPLLGGDSNAGLLGDEDESIMPDEADIAAVNALFTQK